LKEAIAREGGLRHIIEESDKDSKRERVFSFLTGEEMHKVWKPKFSLADVVAQNMNKQQPKDQCSQSVTLPVDKDKETSLTVKSLQEDHHRRSKTLMKRVNFAWKVLQDNPPEEQVPLSGKQLWKAAAQAVSQEAGAKKQTDFSRIVAGLVAKQKAKDS
jgi:hypothetical protein